MIPENGWRGTEDVIGRLADRATTALREADLDERARGVLLEAGDRRHRPRRLNTWVVPDEVGCG